MTSLTSVFMFFTSRPLIRDYCLFVSFILASDKRSVRDEEREITFSLSHSDTGTLGLQPHAKNVYRQLLLLPVHHKNKEQRKLRDYSGKYVAR